jgi:hypothetical protein
MRRTRLVCAIGMSLWSTAVAANQLTVPETLTDELRVLVQDGRFGVVTSIRGLPLGIRETLQTLFGSGTLDIAEPGDDFQRAGGNVDSTLPLRRLIAAACTNNRCLVYYERGGAAQTRHVLLFHWTPAVTRVEWGGVVPRDLATIDEVRKAILAGGIDTPSRFW